MSRSGIPTGSAIAQPPSQNQQKSIIEIYTDWANHYLDKLPKSRRRRISDLQTELNDGLVLADVIEAVTGHKIAEINRKPRSPGHMAENIQRCLELLHATGVQGVEEIVAKDIRDGNLKAILGLFFQLSRFKQQQKQLQKGQLQGGGLLERTGTPKIPSVPNSPAKLPAGFGPGSAIPSPVKKAVPNGDNKKSAMLSKIGGGRQLSSSSLKQPSPSKKGSAIPAPGVTTAAASQQQLPPRQEKTSMLEKLKLKRPGSSSSSSSPQKQNGGGSSANQIQPPQQQMTLLPMPSGGPGQVRYQYREAGLGKRTSSSSGFSSARSVGSESSVSLSSDTNFPSPSALRRINENSTFSSPKKSIPSPGSHSQSNSPRHHQQQQQSSPKQQRSALKKFSSPRNSATGSSSSPKRSPKFQRANGGGTEIKDYGPIDGVVAQQGKYPPHSQQQQQPKTASAVPTRLPQMSAANSGQSRIPGFSNYSASSASKLGQGRIPTGIPGAGAASGHLSSSSSLSNGKCSSSKAEAAIKTANAAQPAQVEMIQQQQAHPLVKPLQPQRSEDNNKKARSSNPSTNNHNHNNRAPESSSCASATTNENGEEIMTASFQSRSCSLPRQKRRDDGSPGPPTNVAVVSPMPSLKKGASLDSSPSKGDSSSESHNAPAAGTASSGKDANEDEEALKSLVPMQPIFSDQAVALGGADNNRHHHNRHAAADPQGHYGFIGQATTLVSAAALTGIKKRSIERREFPSIFFSGTVVGSTFFLWTTRSVYTYAQSVGSGTNLSE